MNCLGYNVFFVIDETGIVGQQNYGITIQGLINFIQNDINPDRIGALAYASNNDIIYSFGNDQSSKTGIINALTAEMNDYNAGLANLVSGLQSAINAFNSISFSESKYIVLITTSASSSQVCIGNNKVAALSGLDTQNIRVIVIALGGYDTAIIACLHDTNDIIRVPTLYATFHGLAPKLCETANPTNTPSQKPTPNTIAPTDNPILNPTTNPSTIPTDLPTYDPTINPTSNPTTDIPTLTPSFDPTLNPTFNPTIIPTSNPTFNPIFKPATDIPTFNPTFDPTLIPTVIPTIIPTLYPTLNPIFNTTTDVPTTDPTFDPTLIPTLNPTFGSDVMSTPPNQRTGPTNITLLLILSSIFGGILVLLCIMFIIIYIYMKQKSIKTVKEDMSLQPIPSSTSPVDNPVILALTPTPGNTNNTNIELPPTPIENITKGQNTEDNIDTSGESNQNNDDTNIEYLETNTLNEGIAIVYDTQKNDKDTPTVNVSSEIIKNDFENEYN